MKKILMILCVSLLTLPASYAQTAKLAKQQAKAAKSKDKGLESAIKENAVKDARKEAKSLEKEGYTTAAGALPLDKQIEKSWKYQYDVDNDGYPVYYVAQATSIGGNYSAAKTQATAMAKANLAEQIAIDIAGVVESQVSNDMYSADDAASITSTVSANKQKFQQTLGRTLPVVEISRTLPNGNIEMKVTIAFNYEKGYEMAKQIIVEDLKAKSERLAREVDEML